MLEGKHCSVCSNLIKNRLNVRFPSQQPLRLLCVIPHCCGMYVMKIVWTAIGGIWQFFCEPYSFFFYLLYLFFYFFSACSFLKVLQICVIVGLVRLGQVRVGRSGRADLATKSKCLNCKLFICIFITLVFFLDSKNANRKIVIITINKSFHVK